MCIRRSSEGSNGAGCATFIRHGISYKEIEIWKDLEYVVVKVWLGTINLVIANFYNPCQRLELEVPDAVKRLARRSVIWCGDFNVHSSLWGGARTNRNELIVEDVMDSSGLVCLTDVNFTRIFCSMDSESCLDSTLVSQSLAGICLSEVMNCTTIGNDHYPILCKVGSGSRENFMYSRSWKQGGRYLESHSGTFSER